MNWLRSVVAILILLVAHTAGAANISYEFSTLFTWHYNNWDATYIEQAAAQDRSYLIAHPGEATPGWRGALSYDPGSGSLTVALLPPDDLVLPEHPVDFGGSAGIGTQSDIDTLRIAFPQNSGLEAFALFGGASYLFDSTELVLSAPGLVVGGQLRSGLTVSDLTDGYVSAVVGNVDYIYGCYPKTWVECMYDGGYYIYYNDAALMLFSISELHEIPEPGTWLAVLQTLLILIATRTLVPGSVSADHLQPEGDGNRVKRPIFG